MLRLFLMLGCVMVIGNAALAQDAADAGSIEKRTELATKMHEFRPSRTQVDNAINAVAIRMPEKDREGFKSTMQNALNYKAIEKISIDAMAETFTEKELEAMVEYYSKPEARSISDKTPAYEKKVGPEIIQMIDKAMMRYRTGATAQ